MTESENLDHLAAGAAMSSTTTVWRSCRALHVGTGYQCAGESGHGGPHSITLDGANGLVWPRSPDYDPDAQGCSSCWNTISAGRHGADERLHCGLCGRGLPKPSEAHRPSPVGWPS